MRRLYGVVLAGLLVGLVGGCPDNPYKASTWTKKLSDQREAENAVRKLEELGDPSAIPALGDAWKDQGKPVRMLQVLIGLARPLTAKQAEDQNLTDYNGSDGHANGRPASWEAALPYLKLAVSEVDDTNPRSVEGAEKASDALGEAKLSDGLDPLIELSNKPVTKKLVTAQIAAIRAIGKFDGDKAKAAAALIKLIEKDPPDHPRTAKDKEQGRALEEKYGLFLGVTGAAINALSDLRTPAAVNPLIRSMYVTPELFTQIRRALVASGPTAETALRSILRGDNKEVNQLFVDKKLDKYCGDRNDAPPDQCQPVSAKDFYPAVVLGDFYDPASVPDLLAALHRPPAPQYFSDDQPSGSTQYNAIFDALRKIGAAEGADQVHALWSKGASGAPTKGRGRRAAPEPAAGGADLMTRILAIGAYPFLARDSSAAHELATIADSPGDNQLRQEAAVAFARLSTDASDIAVLLKMAQTQFKAANDQKNNAAKEKPKADAAEKEFEAAKKAYDDAKAAAAKITADKSRSLDDVKAAIASAKKADDDFKVAKKKHKEGTAQYKAYQRAADDLTGYARMFQTHVARIAVTLKCKKDMGCYVKTLAMTPDQAMADVKQWVPDTASWSKDEKFGLVEGEVERAMLELGKQGQAASQYADTLLDAAKSDDRLIRQSILLALPKIAKVPCNNCETKLDAAIKAGEGKSTLGDLNLETTMLRNYFAWAGGKTPSSPTPEAPPPEAPKAPPPKPDKPAEAPAPAPTKAPAKAPAKGGRRR
ncbi:MAG: hypothetical protein ACM31C_33745 [Acidobacteriota bacterium]